LEILEDRTLLSTYVVNSLTDTGSGSGLAGDLRYCLTKATSGNDTITFEQGLTGTIQLQSPLPALSASVDIQGPGAGTLTVTPTYLAPGSQPFSVGSAANVQISGLTFSGVGAGVSDGVAANAGTLTVSACTVSGFYATEIFSNDGTMLITDCTLSSGAYASLFNPSLSNSSALTISDCTLTGIWMANDQYLVSPAPTVTVSYTSLSGGSSISNFGGSVTVSYCTVSGCGGSAIQNYGNLTINNSTIANNEAIGRAASVAGSGTPTIFPAGNGGGGGIYMGGGTLSINSSTIADNEAIGGSTHGFGGDAGNGYGGGLYIAGGTVSINNSTLADNQALGGAGGHGTETAGSGTVVSKATSAGNGYGGGLYLAGGTVSIHNSTLADNQALSGNGNLFGAVPGVGNGGGIDNTASPSALTMYDTILAVDSASTAGPDLDGGVTSQGFNLIGNSTGGSGFAASDLVNVNPQFGPLQNKGGPTQTMALLPGSPAINAGDTANAPAYDQRGPGFPRIVDGTIDIGAFEVQPNQLSSFSISGFPASITAGSAGTFTVTALNADGSTDTSYTGTVHFTSSDSKAGLPANYTFTSADAGVHIFSAILKTAGTQSITVQDTATGISKSQTGIVVNPAAASSFSVRGFPSPVTAGVAGSFSVTAVDPIGNTATGYSGTVHFTSSDAKAVLPANYTFQASDQGAHIFSATLKTAGTQSITAKDTSAGFSGSDTGITVNPAAAGKFIITAPSSVNASVAFSLTLTVQDADGNVVTGYTGTVHFSSTDTQATLPRNYTFTAADRGVHTFSGLVLRKRGNQKITVTDTHNSSLTGSIVVDVL
jgi:hypothetical protein